MIKHALFTLLFLAGVVYAQAPAAAPMSANVKFSWTLPTTYANAAKTAMPATDIQFVQIYDGDTSIYKGMGAVSTPLNPIKIDFTECTTHVFTISVTTILGFESVRSNSKALFMCQPGAPTTFMISF